MSLEKLFHLKENHTDAKTEVIAGITTFMTMAYILAVNPNVLGASGMDSGAVFTATALAAMVGTLMMALFANYPFVLAPGMGLNAYFAYTVVLQMGYSWEMALAAVFVEGVVFIVLSVTNVREAIFNSIPMNLKYAVSVGIGLFIAFIGMQNVGLVVDDGATLVNLHSFNIVFGNVTWGEIMPVIVTILAVVVIGALSKKQVKGAVFWGIIGGAVLYYLLGFTVSGFYDGFAASLSFNPIAPFKDFFNIGFGAVFTKGFDFSAWIAANSVGSFVLTFICSMLAFCMVDMFDTLGTLFGACSVGGLLDKDGNVPRMEKAMLADAVATCFGAVCGTSTVTTFVESSAGVAEGGRTGLTSVACAAMFLITMFLAPIARLIPSCATAAALIYVGILMIGGVKDIEWDDPTTAVPAFLTMAIMPLTYNISYGIAFGLISYILIKLFSGKIKEIKAGTWVIGILFTVMFFVSH